MDELEIFAQDAEESYLSAQRHADRLYEMKGANGEWRWYSRAAKDAWWGWHDVIIELRRRQSLKNEVA